jgi:hypothetical protein
VFKALPDLEALVPFLFYSRYKVAHVSRRHYGISVACRYSRVSLDDAQHPTINFGSVHE